MKQIGAEEILCYSLLPALLIAIAVNVFELKFDDEEE